MLQKLHGCAVDCFSWFIFFHWILSLQPCSCTLSCNFVNVYTICYLFTVYRCASLFSGQWLTECSIIVLTLTTNWSCKFHLFFLAPLRLWKIWSFECVPVHVNIYVILQNIMRWWIFCELNVFTWYCCIHGNCVHNWFVLYWNVSSSFLSWFVIQQS